MRQQRLDRYDICAVAIIAAGTLIRLAMILLGWPAPYNDEGTLGLMALHIAYRGAHPLLYYGQDYLGSLEAYIGAGFFHLFGPSTTTLRLSLILFFALFLTCMYLLTSLLYTKGMALFVITLLGLGASDVLLRQLMAVGGTPELFFFTALLLLLTARLALTAYPTHRKYKDRGESNDQKVPSERSDMRLPRSRLLAYAAWGAIAGLDMWSHLLCLPFVVSAGLLLALFCRRELRLPALSSLVVCLLIGMSPLLIYKATTPVTPEQTSLFAGTFGGGYHEPAYPPPVSVKKPLNMEATTAPAPIAPRPLLQVAGTLLIALPVATNGMVLCSLSPGTAWPLSDQASRYTRFCTSVHGIWGLGYVVLWFIAAIAAARFLLRYWRRPPEQEHASDQRQEAIRQSARLMILLGAGLTLLAFAFSAQASAVTPWTSSRYLVGLLIALPAVVFPLWKIKDVVQPGAAWARRFKGSSCLALLMLVFAASLLGTSDIFKNQVPGAEAGYERQQGLVEHLVQLGATHIYTDYDDCNRIAFLSNEQIVCAVLDKGLRPGLDRYFPYRAMVNSWPTPFYVFPVGTAQQILFEQKAAEQHIAYVKLNINGYTVYKPEQRIVT